MQRATIISLRFLNAVTGLVLAASAGAALADTDKNPAGTNPTFGNRAEKPDGSVAMTVGRRLPTEWDAKIGTDVSLAGPTSNVLSERLLPGAAPSRSTGAIWGNLTMPGLVPFVWDKTAIEARVDAGNDQSKLGATLSRSMPFGENLSVTLQNSYSVTHSLPQALNDSGAPASVLPLAAIAQPEASTPEASSIWSARQSVRFNISPTGTALSAGTGASTADEQWHNKLSVEQTIYGPLKVTTSFDDVGTTTANKSITAAFKRVW